MRRREKFLRTLTPKFLPSRSPSPTPPPPPPPNPTPSQPSSELVPLLRDPDLPTFVTSVGQDVTAALKDIGEVLGHFPFVKTIGGLTVQILKIVELDINLSTNLKASAIEQTVTKLLEKIEEVDAHVKDGILFQQQQVKLLLLGQLRTFAVRGTEWQPKLACYKDTHEEILHEIEEWLFSWPNPQLSQHLLECAGGLFIWALIVCDFLEQSPDLDADLPLILNPPLDAMDDPEEMLWAVYRVVLEQAYSHLKQTIYQDSFCPLLAAIMSVTEPLTLVNLTSLVGIKDTVAKAIVESLHAVLRSPLNPVSRFDHNEATVRVVHPSFY
ncbi:hypothetical protein JAAARDRAFT_192515 [Jaapia argillacea MUCL 33604]|uniref:Uncharacterized protein n=1 Tax=Jaapia argillacea MUCL 33604 TaxID=933084 RepID=A0A067Q8P9_9AGAM|nr:hypothetical protein JAAARDRAFT_192515 [Jaapia argillacea MUCL 33604]